MIEDLINNEKKITWRDMQTIQSDILDVQMRHSKPDMIEAVEKGLDS